ncbi:peptidase [Brachyspira hyodysenteriae]|uniref:peptidase n=1 Tax=Brachyspira hyodysenteriae TaxID=159 RepID=UPI0022CD6786|nr:peptidase [Brachyspira hyodysenteriae]MCZ9838751.1 peptidase [Brachyspira hyodysenteriae]MCZ9848038.1 peptidase [Brachyspira hyodysenteriae]MCZ9851203.1 peptidase [Brachyspira hyodysenteriae]MCZ9860071.1 peptidase [Brachyspira hyodysenteriae]MCZ9870573.1 peptidase [Brachyspira hyodysenteriae]
MRKIGFVIIINIAMIIIASCSSSQYKLEKKAGGNNTFETAQKINKDGIIGQLEGDNTDYYYFTFDGKASIIDFYVSNSAYSPVIMTLYDYKNNLIKVINEPDEVPYTEANPITNDIDTNETVSSNNNQNKKEDEMIYTTQIMKNIYFEASENNIDENKYYISIAPKDNVKENIDYMFIIKKRDYKETDEKEPNDKISAAQIIDVNSDNRLYTIDGYYSQTYNPTLKTGDLKNLETDAYKITNSSFNTYSISIELSGVPAIDASIRLYDQKGNWITMKDINNTGDGETVDKLILYPYMSYYFILASTNAVNNIPYRVSIIAKPYDKYIEHEPNNKPQEAQTIEFNQTYKGAIDYSYDRDYYNFSIPIKSSVKLSYFLIDSQAINISISNDILGKIITMPQTDDEQEVSLSQGRYYLIFERDLTKEGWKKGISKARNYEFNMSISNEISGDYNYGYDLYNNTNAYEMDYYNYSNNYLNDNNIPEEQFEENLESNFNNTNNVIIIRPEDYNSEYYYYSNEEDTNNNENMYNDYYYQDNTYENDTYYHNDEDNTYEDNGYYE